MDDEFRKVVEYDRILNILSDQAASALGRKEALRIRPADSVDRIRRWLAETEEMRRYLKTERLPLRGLSDLRHLLDVVKEERRPFEPEELLGLGETLEVANDLIGRLAPLGDKYPHLADMTRHISTFPGLESRIRQSIEGDGTISNGASSRLKKIRRKIEKTRENLTEKLAEVVSKNHVQQVLSNPVPTWRDGRYVLAVKSQHRHAIRGVVHDRSKSGATTYIEPEATVYIGNELSDLLADERQEVRRILRELTQEVLNYRDELEELARALTRIDLTYAKARLSERWECSAPILDPEGPVRLRDARHPILLELAREEDATDTVVPIDLRLRDPDRLLILTGPNTGGKTVALKTAGLLAAMAQTGLHIPCQNGSRLPVFETFHADIGDEQSIDQSLSTFSSHIARIKEILEKAGERSLVLIDELGAGTDPLEGSALGAAILEALLDLGTAAMVSTHLGQLKRFAYSRKGAENACVDFDPETLSPTYRVLYGQPGSSNAIAISRRLGVDETILARAEELLGAKGLGEKTLLEEIRDLRMDAEERRAEAERLEKEARQKREETAALKEEVKQKGAVLEAEADEEMETTSQQLLGILEEACREFRNAPKPWDERMEKVRDVVEEILDHTPFGEKRREFAASLKKGDDVRVLKLDQTGCVTRINKSREEIKVKLDSGLEIECGFEDLSWI